MGSVVPSTSAKKALGTMKLHLIFILAVWSCAEWGRVDGQNPPTMPNFPSFDPRGAQHNHPQEDPADSSPPEEECCPCNHRGNGHGHNSQYGGGYGYNSHNGGYGGYGRPYGGYGYGGHRFGGYGGYGGYGGHKFGGYGGYNSGGYEP